MKISRYLVPVSLTALLVVVTVSSAQNAPSSSGEHAGESSGELDTPARETSRDSAEEASDLPDSILYETPSLRGKYGEDRCSGAECPGETSDGEFESFDEQAAPSSDDDASETGDGDSYYSE